MTDPGLMTDHKAPKTTVVHLALDLRLTAEDFAPLTPDQIAAVFEGVGKLVALQHGSGRTPEPSDEPEGSQP